jgi:hypothetical protein
VRARALASRGGSGAPGKCLGHGKPKGPKVTCLHKDDVIL